MPDWLLPVRNALDRATTPVAIFIRDDDAGWDDPALHRLLDRCARHAIAIDLAAIPAAMSDSLAHELHMRIEAGESIGVHQHGFSHTNHQGSGRKCEFGDERSGQQQHDDIAAGQQRLARLFGRHLDRFFTPPWNRCNQDTADALNALGFALLSRDRTAAPIDAAHLIELPVAVDWSKWMHDPDGLTVLAGKLVQALASPGPCGIMLHHADMRPADLDALEALLALLANHPMALSTSMARCATACAPQEAASCAR